MDLRTARAMSYVLIVNKVAKKHGILPEDAYYLMAVCAVAAVQTSTSAGAVATSMLKAPPEVIDSLKKIIAIIRDKVALMESDPEFMAKLEKGIVELTI